MSTSRLAAALLTPRTIALVGASGDAEKDTSRPQRFLRKHGFAGRVIPINPNRTEVLGERAYANLLAAPGPIDHVFVMVPAKAVLDVIAECSKAKIPVATIYSDGFAESGEEGRELQRRLVDTARAGGVRLIGPNSMGIINTEPVMPLAVAAVLDHAKIEAGSLAVISQSGTMLGALLSRGQARGMGFSRLISVGNEADLTVGEIADLLIDDPATTTILLFLETLRDPDKLAAMARRAYAANKPVIAYKLGRSAVGRELARSHSGAMTGPQESVNAFFRHHGILRVDMLETLLEMPALVSGRKPATGRRVAVLTTTGGGAGMVVDQLGARGIELISAPAKVVARLKDMRLNVNTRAPLVDLTMAGTRKGVYGPVLNELLASPECDAVVAVVGSSGQYHPELAVEPIISAKRKKKPLATFIVPQADKSLALLAKAEVAAFRTPEACADAVRAYLDWSAPVTAEAVTSGELSDVETVLGATEGSVLTETEAREVFHALGIPQAPAHMLDDAERVSRVGYPVAAKIVSPDIPHKTEAGAVVLDIPDDSALQQSSRGLMQKIKRTHPTAKITGILVQRMQSGLAEAIIGYKHDPETGPIVMLGVGGQLTEIYRDFALRLAPVSRETAQGMIEEVRGLAVIRGYRHLPAGDREALAAAVCALSKLAHVTSRVVLEAEINPLIIKPAGTGVVAVDGLVICRA
jgi:acyl-CoA synthetase (NDP forming)